MKNEKKPEGEKLVEVEDFGIDLNSGELDGFAECPKCAKELHFVIRKTKMKELIDGYKKALEQN